MAIESSVNEYLAKQLYRVTQKDSSKSDRVLAVLNDVFDDTLDSAGIKSPLAKVHLARFGELIFRAQFEDQTLQIISPTCPPYSARLNNQTGEYIFDFSKLDDDIGLTGKKLIQTAPVFLTKLRQAGVANIAYSIAIADVEAEDPEILGGMNMDKDSFLQHLNNSKTALEESLDQTLPEIPHHTYMMRDLISLEDQQRAAKLIPEVKEAAITTIAISRGDLYSRWFRRYLTRAVNFSDFCNHRVMTDISKMLEFGSSVRRQGFVVLDPTSPQLANYYNFGDGLPPTPTFLISTSY